MAWLDDRVWCHPKLADLTDRQFRVWVNGIAYSSGFGTRGVLTPGQQKTIGCDTKTRNALVKNGAWDEWGTDGSIRVHDWDPHNLLRDDRRERERTRKKKARSEGRWNEADRTPPHPDQGRAPSPAPTEAPARVEGSDGSEGTNRKTSTNSKAVPRPPGTALDTNNVRNLIDKSLKETA